MYQYFPKYNLSFVLFLDIYIYYKIYQYYLSLKFVIKSKIAYLFKNKFSVIFYSEQKISLTANKIGHAIKVILLHAKIIPTFRDIQNL